MTQDQGSTFDAFRHAESLVAQRRPLDALVALGPVLDAEPDAPSVHLLAGRAYLGSAQLRRAETAFLRVLELDPTDHYARFALGKTLQRQSRLTEAQTQLRIAVAMNPLPEYQEALGEVNARIAVDRDR
ncbi:tetratricopeptide repeat protein [Actinokineospora auranticolor]|uniref:Tetratricopeptide repeat protein n=1 Tax=Actinokineospora auranticolor TaxID=155976 RepID=A0A2S6GYT7_9PSEU|nr:tetratricopeptide repeat protein [Actinokineospora auranticolor]PPK70321.1 tetratricopeptide repeat protein [Actinokineospora auranticolor]